MSYGTDMIKMHDNGSDKRQPDVSSAVYGGAMMIGLWMLTVALLVLDCCGVISVPWWVVALPVAFPAIVAIVIGIIFGIVKAIISR